MEVWAVTSNSVATALPMQSQYLRYQTNLQRSLESDAATPKAIVVPPMMRAISCKAGSYIITATV